MIRKSTHNETMSVSCRKITILSASILVIAVIIWYFGSPKKYEPLKLLPADAIAYVEIKNLKELKNIIAKNTPDDSPALDVSIAIMGFELLPSDNIENETFLNLKPHFVAVSQTGYSERINADLIKKYIHPLIERSITEPIYIQESTESDAKWLTWKSGDEEKFFVVLSRDLIYASNDKNAVMKTLSVKNGNSENLSIKIPKEIHKEAEDAIIFGYADKKFVSLMANFLGSLIGVLSSDELATQRMMAQITSLTLSESINNIRWKMIKRAENLEDVFILGLDEDVSVLLKASWLPRETRDNELLRFIPKHATSFSIYAFQNPTKAWMAVFDNIARKTRLDKSEISRVKELMNLFFAPYGISDPQRFLNSVNSDILVIRFPEDESVIITKIKNLNEIKAAILNVNFSSHPIERESMKIWRSKEGTLSAAFNGNLFLLGNTERLLECLQYSESFQGIDNQTSPILTYTKDERVEHKLDKMPYGTDQPFITSSIRKTQLQVIDEGLEYRMISNHGFIGLLVTEHLSP